MGPLGELGVLFNPGMRHELEERRVKQMLREEEGTGRKGDLRLDLESGVAVIPGGHRAAAVDQAAGDDAADDSGDGPDASDDGVLHDGDRDSAGDGTRDAGSAGTDTNDQDDAAQPADVDGSAPDAPVSAPGDGAGLGRRDSNREPADGAAKRPTRASGAVPAGKARRTATTPAAAPARPTGKSRRTS